MAKYETLVFDPPWSFSDTLTMSSVKRGAEANYKSVMLTKEICSLPVQDISADNSILALWTPGSLIQDGMNVMKAWGFEQKQTWIWVKVKLDPLKSFKKLLTKDCLNEFKMFFNMNETLAFGMGRLFRQCHELALIGTKGSVYKNLENKSQRSVYFDVISKHSQKPAGLQDQLDFMFPNHSKIEGFARQQRNGWVTVGNECPGEFLGEDIRDSIKRLSLL